jgi:hypothetical protein
MVSTQYLNASLLGVHFISERTGLLKLSMMTIIQQTGFTEKYESITKKNKVMYNNITMAIFKKNDLRCPVCLAEYNSVEMAHAGIKHCPACKTVIQPMRIEHDGYIKINWHNIRVLANYARRWTLTFDIASKGNRDAIQALLNIINALSVYRPKQAEPIVPQIDPVMEGYVQQVEYTEPEGVIELKADHTGNIPSPWFKKL